MKVLKGLSFWCVPWPVAFSLSSTVKSYFKHDSLIYIIFCMQITSTDGQSCSGQTPDISWENFQKKGCPRTKMWHGKRYSCKIDGVEVYFLP